MFTIDPDDVAAALRLLEREPMAHSWTLTRITNEQHSLQPVGPGIGVTLLHYVPARGQGRIADIRQVFEKAGEGRPLEVAVKVAIERLRGLLSAIELTNEVHHG